MDTRREQEILEEARRIYNSALGRMPGLEKWTDSFKGAEEYFFVNELSSFINRKNQNVSTRVFDIDYIFQREFLDYLSINNPLQ